MSACVEMALALKNLGHQPTLVSFDDPASPFLSALPLELSIRAIGPGKGAWGAIPNLAGRLSGLAADVVVLNGLWLFSTTAVARWARHNKIPYVLFPHGMLDPYFKRFWFKHLKKTIYWWLFEARTLARAACVCYTTASEKTLASRSFFPFVPRRQEVVGLGLESYTGSAETAAAAFRQHFPALGEKTPYLLYLSRFHAKKGADLLLKALHANPGLTLVMAGPLHGTDGEVAARLKDLAPVDRILWTGMLTGELKWGALAGASALALTSHQENFGMVVAEALSVGTPVLVSDKVAISGEVAAAHAGLVCRDTLSGVQTMLKAFRNLSPAELAAMRKAALDCFEKNFQPACVAKRLEGILQESLP